MGLKRGSRARRHYGEHTLHSPEQSTRETCLAGGPPPGRPRTACGHYGSAEAVLVGTARFVCLKEFVFARNALRTVTVNFRVADNPPGTRKSIPNLSGKTVSAPSSSTHFREAWSFGFQAWKQKRGRPDSRPPNCSQNRKTSLDAFP